MEEEKPPESPRIVSIEKRRYGIAPRVGQPVECYCWCMKEIILIPVEWVSRGQTGSCGGFGCNGP